MKRHLVGILLGSLLTLILFGFTPLLPSFKITLKSPLFELLTAFGTIGAVLVSLFGETFKNKFYPSKVEIVDKSCIVQEGASIVGISRLRLRNTGSGIAKYVSVYVDSIYDELTGKRDNFLPVPLQWTHDGRHERDLMKGQYWHLNLVEINHTNKYRACLVLYAGGGVPQYEEIYVGATTLELIVYHSLGSKKYEVKLDWHPNNGDNFVSIISFNEKFE